MPTSDAEPWFTPEQAAITPEPLAREVREVLDAQPSIASTVAGGCTSNP